MSLGDLPASLGENDDTAGALHVKSLDMESTNYLTERNGLVSAGRQPRAFAILAVGEIESRIRRLDALIEIWDAATEGRDVIETQIREAFRDLEALNLLGELL